MARKNKEYGPSQGAKMLHGLAAAARQIRDEEMSQMGVPSLIRAGDEVIVRQFNGKMLKGCVAAVLDSVHGREFKVICGPLVLTVDEKQVKLIGVQQK